METLWQKSLKMHFSTFGAKSQIMMKSKLGNRSGFFSSYYYFCFVLYELKIKILHITSAFSLRLHDEIFSHF